MEICLSDATKPRCFECTKDNIPALNPKKCFCGKTYPWVENDGMTRTLTTCEDRRKTQQMQKKNIRILPAGKENVVYRAITM